MLPSLAITDAKILKSILVNIQLSKRENDSWIENIFPYFPFKAMMDNSPETASVLLDILEHFLDSNQFLRNTNSALSYAVEFTLANITYFIKRNDDRMLVRLIRFLYELFSSLKYVVFVKKLEFDLGRICELIVPLMEHNYLRSPLALMLTQILSLQIITFAESNAIIDFCISKFFFYMEPDRLELCKLAAASLRATPHLKIRRTNRTYEWLYEVCPKLLDKASIEIVTNVLECIVLAFETTEENDFKLTKVYAAKITTLYRLLRNKSLICSVMKIFCYIISDFVDMGILPLLEDELMQIIELIKKSKTKCSHYHDVMLVVDYLQCLQSPYEISKPEATASIVKRCANCVKYPVIVLKSLCLLFPTFFLNQNSEITTRFVENNILDAVEQYAHLSQVLTYNLRQLQWFLKSNRVNLKIIVLEIYLANYENDKVILDALENTNTADLLVHCLLTNTKKEIPERHLLNLKKLNVEITKLFFVCFRAAHLLSHLQCPKISILLKKQLPLSFRSETSLMHLLTAEPALPTSISEGILFCTMMSNLLPVLTIKDAFIGACHYTYKLLIKFKSNREVVEAFIFNEYAIGEICKTGTSNDDEIACSSITLLVILLKLQRRHYIKIYHTIFVDFCKLISGSSTRLLKSISLLQLSLTYRMSKPILCARKEDIINVYQHLQALQCIDVYSEVFTVMTKLLKTYSYLGYLFSTLVYIEVHCRKLFKTKDQVQSFLSFLLDWLENISKTAMPLYNSWMSIYLFLKEQPDSDMLKRLLYLLNICPGRQSNF